MPRPGQASVTMDREFIEEFRAAYKAGKLRRLSVKSVPHGLEMAGRILLSMAEARDGEAGAPVVLGVERLPGPPVSLAPSEPGPQGPTLPGR